MADPGFPWLAQPNEKEGVLSSEKVPDAITWGSTPQPPQSEVATRSPSSSPTSSPKKHIILSTRRRGGSMKAPPSARPGFKALADARTPKDESFHIPVRTIPPWVRDAEEDDLDDLDDPQSALPESPHAAFIAHHNHSPSAARRPMESGGQPWRKGHVTSSGHVRPERTSRWISFARASAYPRENFHSEKVDTQWLDQHFTDYSKPWLAGHDDDDVEDGSSRYHAFRKKRQVWYKRSQFTLLRNPFIPLVFRLIVISFAIIAVGLGGSIYHETGKVLRCIAENPATRDKACLQRIGREKVIYYGDPSALMAIIVDIIAVVYSMYITYDEYFSKPLGLRSARAKVRLVLLDLFFIVFQAANLSLSFESLTFDEGACQVGQNERILPRFANICDRARALSSVLLVSLFAWLLTFSVSVFRLVERINVK